jgi:hypothetical protein
MPAHYLYFKFASHEQQMMVKSAADVKHKN